MNTTPEKANIGKILGTSIFGFVSELTKAKEDGKQLPGLLDDVATLALNAKEQGVNFVKEEAKQEAKKLIPWIGLGIAVIVIIILLSRQ